MSTDRELLEAFTAQIAKNMGSGDFTIKQYGESVSLTWSEDGSVLWQQEGDTVICLHPLWVEDLAKQSSIYRDALALRPCSKGS